MAEKAKVTTMVIKVDLDCDKCRRKIKKVLCCIPQVQNQVYDEKTNTVTVTVICCSPEKIKQKICYKGGGSVKGIEIKVPEKPKEKPKEPEKPKQPEKTKEPEKPKAPEKPKEAAKPKEPEKPKEPAKPKEAEKPKEPEKPKEAEKPKPAPAPPKALISEPVVQGYPPLQIYPRGSLSCPDYYNGGYYGEPCHYDPYRPQPSYEYGRPVYDSWGTDGGYRGYYVGSKTGQCFSDENAAGCIIM